MNEFEKIIQQERERHEVLQLSVAPFFEPIFKPKTFYKSSQPRHDEVKLRYSDREVATAAAYTKMRKDTDCMHKVLGPELFIQFEHVSPVVTTIVGWLISLAASMVSESTNDRRVLKITDDMEKSTGIMYGRLSRNGDAFVDEVKFFRRKMMEDGGLTRHIVMLKEQYRLAILNAGSPVGNDNENGNDLVAWLYTAIALAEIAYDYEKYVEEQYNTMKPKNDPRMILHAFHTHDTYPGVKETYKFLQHYKFPKKLTNANIETARKCVYTNLRLSKIYEYFEKELEIEMMKGKKIKIA